VEGDTTKGTPSPPFTRKVIEDWPWCAPGDEDVDFEFAAWVEKGEPTMASRGDRGLWEGGGGRRSYPDTDTVTRPISAGVLGHGVWAT